MDYRHGLCIFCWPFLVMAVWLYFAVRGELAIALFAMYDDYYLLNTCTEVIYDFNLGTATTCTSGLPWNACRHPHLHLSVLPAFPSVVEANPPM